jgi:predicted RNA-binding protein with PUA-like domain
MAVYLLKTEPDDYAYADLVRDKRTHWDGVANPGAQMAMRAIKKGDEAFVYHTGKERRIAGLATIVKGAYPDPEHPGETAKGDPKRVHVDLAPVKAATTDATLAMIKADERFSEFALVKQSRLSAMEVPPKLAAALKKMAGL